MSNKVKQTPGRLDIVITKGDDWSFLVDFDIDMTGYTFSSALAEGDTSTITVTNTDLANGQVTLSQTDTVSGAIAAGTYKWYLDHTNAGSQRRLLAGDFIVVVYKE